MPIRVGRVANVLVMAVCNLRVQAVTGERHQDGHLGAVHNGIPCAEGDHEFEAVAFRSGVSSGLDRYNLERRLQICSELLACGPGDRLQ
ncbi:hypothetical protein D3C86_2100750 [compost metagenome]